MKASARANRFWDKLIGWYGSSLTEQFGQTPPPDWCALVDEASNDTVKGALAEIRQRHVTFPPKFPEVESIFAKLQRPRFSEPSMQEQLCEYVTRNYQLTPMQLAKPWRFLYRGHCGYAGTPASADYAVVGVVIPADGDAPGHRIMVEDMALGTAA